VLTCPVEHKCEVYDLLRRTKLGAITPDQPSIELTIDRLDDRARFLYIGDRWEQRARG